MVKAGNFDENTLESILDEISPIVGRNSSELAVDLGLKQIDGELGKNPMRGILMLEAAAENNNDRALSALFKCYRDGRGPIEVDKDNAQIWYTRLKLIWTQASEKGNVEAIWGLGELCLDDTFESTDVVRAEELFLKVIESNIPEYLHKLGIYYRKGVFGEDSKPLGEHYIKRAEKLWTEQGGEFFIGKIYYDGDLGESDFAEAKKWFEKCSDIDAIYYLAKIYLHEQDYNSAKDNLLKLIPYSRGFAEEIKELLGEMPSPSDWIMPLANQDTLLLGIVQDLDRLFFIFCGYRNQ
jgi:tetratricopeptide (TPR) repeat protein